MNDIIVYNQCDMNINRIDHGNSNGCDNEGCYYNTRSLFVILNSLS